MEARGELASDLRMQHDRRMDYDTAYSTYALSMAFAQGFGGPCCARILTSWFATKERGTYWGMWNIAHNLGGFGAPILAGTAARYYGWKWGEP